MKMEGVGALGNETGRLSKFDFHPEGAGAPWKHFKHCQSLWLEAESVTSDIGIRFKTQLSHFLPDLSPPTGKEPPDKGGEPPRGLGGVCSELTGPILTTGGWRSVNPCPHPKKLLEAEAFLTQP